MLCHRFGRLLFAAVCQVGQPPSRETRNSQRPKGQNFLWLPNGCHPNSNQKLTRARKDLRMK